MVKRKIPLITVILLLSIYSFGKAASWNFAVFGDSRDNSGDPGGLNMRIAGQSADSLQTGLGWRLGVEMKVGTQRLTPQLYASYQHEFLNRSRSIDARLDQGSDVFQIKTDKPTRNFALIGCGIAADVSPAVNLLAGYEAGVGQRKYTSHRFDARASISYSKPAR